MGLSIPGSDLGNKRKRPRLDTAGRTLRKRRSTSPTGDELSTSKPNIKALEAQISDSQCHYNNIVTLLGLARKEVTLYKSKVPALVALCRTFCRLQARGRLSRSFAGSDKALTVVKWLRERHIEYKGLLLKLVSQPQSGHHELALALGLQLVQEECGSVSTPDSIWRSGIFFQLLEAALLGPHEARFWETFVNQYARPYDDVRYYTFCAVDQILRKRTLQTSDVLRSNTLALLSRITPLSSADVELASMFCEGTESKHISLLAHRKQAQQAWLSCLNAGLDKEQRKIVLGIMTHHVVPWFQSVELLMDFLTDSYNVGGTTSLLALSGLFHLIQEKNLDYPEFFPKVYSLLNGELMFSKHRSRFFRLLNTFMASTHLPAALVASFVKRLSRLALHGPPAGIVAILPWIYNMLKTHPACTFMIHREPRTDDERQALEMEGAPDPFAYAEKDPMYTGAIDSCLWELETLQSHYHPNVAALARIISEQFTKSSYNFDDFLDHSYGSLIESELSRDLKKPPVVEYEIPKTIFKHGDGNDSLERLMTSIVEVDS